VPSSKCCVPDGDGVLAGLGGDSVQVSPTPTVHCPQATLCIVMCITHYYVGFPIVQFGFGSGHGRQDEETRKTRSKPPEL